MPFTKGNPGRRKGAINKTTKAAKEMISEAAVKLGGLKRLVEWVKEDEQNQRIFWGSMYVKLLPLEVKADVDLTGALEITRRELKSKADVEALEADRRKRLAN